MPTLQNLLAEINRLLIAYLAKRPLSLDEQEAHYEKLRLDWTYHSNALEGNSLTLGETAFYLREGLTSEGKPLVDYLEIKNHTEAIDWLFQIVKEQCPITEGFIKDLNALLHKGITERPAIGANGQKFMRKITPGQYKQQANHVLTVSGKIHYYIEPVQVHTEMSKLIELINNEEKKLHPVELAAAVHYEITRIHPFDDCNGRTARLLLNLLLMRAKYPPIVIKTEDRRKYLEALEQADQGNREPFYLFVAEHVRAILS
ncbi:MAG: Fic family protein [Patescibacteria group bacterium]|jgi:Fic family protein